MSSPETPGAKGATGNAANLPIARADAAQVQLAKLKLLHLFAAPRAWAEIAETTQP
jgi:hypothetical protein